MRALLARDCIERMLDLDVSVADACSRAIERGILQACSRLTVTAHQHAACADAVLAGHSMGIRSTEVSNLALTILYSYMPRRRTGSRRTAACWRYVRRRRTTS